MKSFVFKGQEYVKSEKAKQKRFKTTASVRAEGRNSETNTLRAFVFVKGVEIHPRPLYL